MNSGIYTITNLNDGKAYIGSTVDFKTRWGNHKNELRRGIHSNSYLQNAGSKYGEDVFEFGILEYVDNLDNLVKAEQFWMDIYREEGKDLYNFGLAADCPARGRNLSKEHCYAIIKAHKGKPSGFTGKKHTEEARRRIGKSREGIPSTRVGYKHSEETKHKISEGIRNMSPKAKAERAHKFSEAKKGRKLSDKHKRRIGEGNKGKKRSEETRRKMSESAKLRWAKIKEIR